MDCIYKGSNPPVHELMMVKGVCGQCMQGGAVLIKGGGSLSQLFFHSVLALLVVTYVDA